MILALLYVILALPYSYRAIDAGVRSIDLHTLVEAGRSMGARWGILFRRVLLPNIRSGVLAAAFLTLALSLGEYTFASLILPSTPTFPVFLAGVVTTSTYYAVALSVLALIVTWGLLVAISVIGSGRKQGVCRSQSISTAQTNSCPTPRRYSRPTRRHDYWRHDDCDPPRVRARRPPG